MVYIKETNIIYFPKTLIKVKFICLLIKGDNANVAVESVVAIPEDKWHLDYLKPKQACVKEDGKCVQALFQNPGEAKKVRLIFPFSQNLKVIL